MRRSISRDGVTYIRLEFVEEPIDEAPLWRPRSAEDSGKSLGDPPEKSIPVWVWGLLKRQPWSAGDLAIELNCLLSTVYRAVGSLRKRGHTIVRRAGSYHLEDDLPLRVMRSPSGGLTLARLRRRSELEITELP